MKKIVCVIPARGGSKGIPRKNIKSLAGKPLISYNISASKNSGHIIETYVSTDDQEIAEISSNFGAKIIDSTEGICDRYRKQRISIATFRRKCRF